MTKLAFLAFLLSFMSKAFSSYADYSIQCAHPPKTKNNFAAKLASPVASIVSEFLHGSCKIYDNGTAHTELKVATWPQYANSTTVHVEGYTYSVPRCAEQRLEQILVLCQLLHLVGAKSELVRWAAMPVEYLSWSVAGATLSLSLGDEEYMLVGWTNQLGHLEAFINVPKVVEQIQDSQTLPGFDSWSDLSRTVEKNSDISTEIGQLAIQECVSTLPRISAQVEIFRIPSQGVTIVSDIDDILRVAEVWNVKQAVLDAFVRSFVPWEDMPEIYRAWFDAVPNAHFHYVTDTPEMCNQFLVKSLPAFYPRGTYDFRPMELNHLSRVINPRKHNIQTLIETFPERKFVLVGDTSVPSTVTTYVSLAKQFPDAIQCIIMRNTSAEPANWIVSPLKGLAKLKGKFIFFAHSEELRGTEELMRQLAAGETVGCGAFATESIPGKIYGGATAMTVTFWQGLKAVMQCALTTKCRFDETYFHPSMDIQYQKQEPEHEYICATCEELAHDMKVGDGEGYIAEDPTW